MNTKIILAIAAVALVAAALVGVTAAQFANTQTPITTVEPNCNNGNQVGYCQNGDCYGYDAQNQNQNQYGTGMMGRNGYGTGSAW